jgi:hypothetical protein
MEQGDDDPGGFLTAEIVSGKQRDNYGDDDRRDPIEEAPPLRDLLVHSFSSQTRRPHSDNLIVPRPGSKI